MKRFPILGVLLLIPAGMLFALVGCTPAEKKDGGKSAAATDKKDDNDKKPIAGGAKTEITTSPDGTVKGMVKFKGTPPEPVVNPSIAASPDAKKGLCGTAADEYEQLWTVSKDGGVANVIISLSPPSDKKFKKLDEKLLKEYTHPVILDQPFCNYVPHVVALYAEYQPLIAKNEAKMSHNVKIEAGAARGGTQDRLVTPGKDTGPISLYAPDAGEAVINTACSIHSWMSAKIGIFNNPYFAVTDKDGKFEIKNVPVDTPLTVYWWHESTGKKTEAQKVTAKKGDNELKSIEIGK